MIVELTRTSRRGGGQPDPLARKETRLVTTRCTCKTLEEVEDHAGASSWFWREGGQNHREEDGMTAVDFEREVWLADIPSLDWAAEQWESLAIHGSDVVGVKWTVEIYDSYRE